MNVNVNDTFGKLWFCDTQPVCFTLSYGKILGTPADYAAIFSCCQRRLVHSHKIYGLDEHEELEEHHCGFEEERRSRREICPDCFRLQESEYAHTETIVEKFMFIRRGIGLVGIFWGKKKLGC